MTGETFNALVLRENDGLVSAAMEEVAAKDLPEGEVTVAVDYSTLNYKDGMILKGIGRLVRQYPHVPGIDFAGRVVESADPALEPGNDVVLTGWRVGEIRWGGYGGLARVKAGWLVPLPEGIDTKRAMAIGTAGFTAMLAVMALEDHGLTPDAEGEVLVTGAVGGVGSVAVALLANLGYRVAASTGREEEADYLTGLGAASVVPRAELEQRPKGPLSSERWAGAIDNVAGPVLANLLTAIRYNGACASVGLAAGFEYDGNVMPFLLRGVSILGIDSGMCPQPRRLEAWRRLAAELPLDKLDSMTSVAPLSEAPDLANEILTGRIKGRTVLDVAK